MLSEKQLIEECKQGIKASQFELVRRYSGMLIVVCRRYTSDEPSAKDVLQETLIRIFKYINKYRGTGSFEAWMRRIAVRSALTWLDKRHFRNESELSDFVHEEKVMPDVYNYIGLEAIEKLILELPIGFRTIFNLNVIEGYSHKEISELMGITESASRSQLSRARKLLQKKLKKSQGNNFPNYKSA